MSTMIKEKANPPYAKSAGISEDLAIAADEELSRWKNEPADSSQVPVKFFDHHENTRAASNAYLTMGDMTPVAQLLGIESERVRSRFTGSEPGTFIELEQEFYQKSLRTDYVFSILALNDMSYTNGLLGLGKENKKHELKKGEALHFMGDLPQTWSGKGGGNFIWFYWKNYETGKELPKRSGISGNSGGIGTPLGHESNSGRGGE